MTTKPKTKIAERTVATLEGLSMMRAVEIPDEQARREWLTGYELWLHGVLSAWEIGQWDPTIRARVVGPTRSRTRGGRGRGAGPGDHRSLEVVVELAEGPASDLGVAIEQNGWGQLLRLRVRDIELHDGTSPNTWETLREQLLQQGIGIPDDLSGLDTAGPAPLEEQ